jgi:hypothetical protein
VGGYLTLWVRKKSVIKIIFFRVITRRLGKIKNQRFRTYYLSHTLKMGQIVPETLVFNLNQNYPKEDNFNTLNHGESLIFNKKSLVSARNGTTI